MERKDVTRAETTGSALMWYGVLAGPIVWACQFLLDYGLDEAVVCAPGSRTPGRFFNVDIETVIQITNAVATCLTLTAFLLSFRAYRRLRGDDDSPGGRALWMAEAGMFVSAIFLIITVSKFASPFFLTPCAHTL